MNCLEPPLTPCLWLASPCPCFAHSASAAKAGNDGASAAACLAAVLAATVFTASAAAPRRNRQGGFQPLAAVGGCWLVDRPGFRVLGRVVCRCGTLRARKHASGFLPAVAVALRQVGRPLW